MLEHWIRLANLQLPPRQACGLLDHFGDPRALFAASAGELEAASAGLRLPARLLDPSFAPTASQLGAAERLGMRAIGREDAEYPRPLREIPDAPPVLFVRGTLEETDRFAVAIVGTRHPTPYGRSVAGKLARDLAGAGLVVASGGAIGIDAAAHRACLEAGGRTVVVLGCGHDVEYPRENQPLFEQIVATGRGAVVSEFPPGCQPEAWRFPQRNRIISGLSRGVVVVEAGRQSGALITATLAGEHGREVMAVPGNVDRPASKGTNALLKDGATLVEDAEDVLRTLGILTLRPPGVDAPERPRRPDLTESQLRLLECLDLTPRHIDSVAAELGSEPAALSLDVTLLELAGVIRRLPGNTFIRVL